ncbi:unnamed protein product, partial [Polarella glacialis]
AGGAGYLIGSSTSSYYMRSQMNGGSCDGYSCCSGCSNSCYNSGSETQCNQRVQSNLYRDDIMQSGKGFYPSDYGAPLYLRIRSISGAGYSAADVCPPAGWNASNATDFTSTAGAFYVTLTPMTELADPDGVNKAGQLFCGLAFALAAAGAFW